MMRAAIFTIDTGLYKAKGESAAAAALKRLLGQAGFEVKAAGVLPQDGEMLAAVLRQLADSGSVELILTTGAAGYLEEDCAPTAVSYTHLDVYKRQGYRSVMRRSIIMKSSAKWQEPRSAGNMN